MKPRVVIFSAFVSPMRSGAEACAEEVSARLQNDFDITIIAAKMRASLPREDRLSSGVKVIRVGFGTPFDKWLYPFLAPFAAKKLQPQLIHAVLESFAGLALAFSKFIVPSAKRLLTCQSTNTSLFLGLLHRSADRVTAISSVLIERARRYGKNATLIPNGIRYAELSSVSAQRVPKRVLFVGRLEKMKGVDTLAMAMEEVPEATLRIVGDGSEREFLELFAIGGCRLGDRVTFVGAVPHDQVAQEYAAAEIFCGLSSSEAFGNVFLEAQAAGCAVVATNVGGIPDIVKNNVTGLLVSPNKPHDAAQAINQLLNNVALRERLSNAGREHAAAYDWDLIAQKYSDVYRSLA